jgi:hypothetical protein
MKTALMSAFLLLNVGLAHASDSALAVDENDPDALVSLGPQPDSACRSQPMNGDVATDLSSQDQDETLNAADVLVR